MHETKEKTKKLGELKEKLTRLLNDEFDCGMEKVCTEEAGEVVDMIKDLADAEKNCWKACYYKKIVEAMEEAEETEELMGKIMRKMDMGEELSESERMGYDHWRYSSGRYAPKGRGHYSAGYVPKIYPWEIHHDPYLTERLGYTGGGSSSGNMGHSDGRYGQSYNNYRDARRYYTERGDASSKKDMELYGMSHVTDTIETVKDIWKDADPEMRKRMKSDLTKMVNEMNV